MNKSSYYLPDVFRALAKGYNETLLRKTNRHIWALCSASYAESIVKSKSDLAIVKSLAQLSSRGGTAFTEETVNALLLAGFKNAKEVKDYAHTFAVGWTDSNFYNRVIKAKAKYPELSLYQPEF